MKVIFTQNKNTAVFSQSKKSVIFTKGTRKVVINDNRGLRGREGLSAYEVWLAQGNVGTEEDFFLATGSVPEVDDSVIALNKTYSSEKIEDRLDEEVGADDFDFVLLFENGLSM